MLKKLFKLFCLAFFLLTPCSLDYLKLDIRFFPMEIVRKQFLETPLAVLGQDEVVIIGSQGNSSVIYEEFIDFQSGGYWVQYDKYGNKVDFYYGAENFHSFKDMGYYPRLSGRFVFLFNEDMKEVTVIKLEALKKGELKPLYKAVSEECFSSWDADEEGRYFILGDLGGNYIIYDVNKKEFQKKQVTQSRINYLKGVNIHSDGRFALLGSLYPELLYLGNAQDAGAKLFPIKIPSTGRTRRQIFLKGDYYVTEKDRGVFLYDLKKEKIITHVNFMHIIDVAHKHVAECRFLYLLFKKGNRIKLEVLQEGRLKYSLELENVYYPQFKRTKTGLYLIWDNGVLKL